MQNVIWKDIPWSFQKKGDKRGNKKPLEEDNLFYCASVHANAVIFFFYANITLWGTRLTSNTISV